MSALGDMTRKASAADEKPATSDPGRKPNQDDQKPKNAMEMTIEEYKAATAEIKRRR